MEDIYRDNRDNAHNARDRVTEPPILRYQVKKAIHVAKNKRATESDVTPTGIFKVLGERIIEHGQFI